MVGVRAALVSDAVVVPEKSRLRIVVETIIRCGPETARRFPLPSKTDERGRGADRVSVGVAGLGCGIGPCRGAIPLFDNVAVASVGDALRRHRRWRGEDVRTVNRIWTVRLVAAQIRNGRLHDDIRIVRDAEVAPVVDGAVLRHVGGVKRMVVLAEGLDCADQKIDSVVLAIAAKAEARVRISIRGVRLVTIAGRWLRRAAEERLLVVCPHNGCNVIIYPS